MQLGQFYFIWSNVWLAQMVVDKKLGFQTVRLFSMGLR